jgi:hypothetical protein
MREETHGQALASFGGITRIRFKGSAPKSFGALSAYWLPRTYFSLRIRLARSKSTNAARVIGYQLSVISYQLTVVRSFVSFVLKLASAPRFTRCYPRSFTFYVANPIRSILRGDKE